MPWEQDTRCPAIKRERVWWHCSLFLVVLIQQYARALIHSIWSLFVLSQQCMRAPILFRMEWSYDCWISTTKKSEQCHQTLSRFMGGVWEREYENWGSGLKSLLWALFAPLVCLHNNVDPPQCVCGTTCHVIVCGHFVYSQMFFLLGPGITKNSNCGTMS